MKKRLFIVVALLLVSFSSIFVGCKDSNSDPNAGNNSANAVVELNINEKELTLELGKTFTLKAYDDAERIAAQWTTDSDCISIDADGVIDAKKVGVAKVTGDTELGKVECIVTVVICKTIPTLQCNASDDLILKLADEYVLTSKLILAGNEETIDSIKCAANSDVVECQAREDGSFNIVAKKAGTAQITLECIWKGQKIFKLIEVTVR